MLQLLESADVARLIERTPGTVRHLVKSGRIRPVAITPRGLRLFRLEDVENFRRQRAVRATSNSAISGKALRRGMAESRGAYAVNN